MKVMKTQRSGRGYLEQLRDAGGQARQMARIVRGGRIEMLVRRAAAAMVEGQTKRMRACPACFWAKVAMGSAVFYGLGATPHAGVITAILMTAIWWWTVPLPPRD